MMPGGGDWQDCRGDVKLREFGMWHELKKSISWDVKMNFDTQLCLLVSPFLCKMYRFQRGGRSSHAVAGHWISNCSRCMESLAEGSLGTFSGGSIDFWLHGDLTVASRFKLMAPMVSSGEYDWSCVLKI